MDMWIESSETFHRACQVMGEIFRICLDFLKMPFIEEEKPCALSDNCLFKTSALQDKKFNLANSPKCPTIQYKFQPNFAFKELNNLTL